jgi:hypothetical protein
MKTKTSDKGQAILSAEIKLLHHYDCTGQTSEFEYSHEHKKGAGHQDALADSQLTKLLGLGLGCLWLLCKNHLTLYAIYTSGYTVYNRVGYWKLP